MDISTSSSLHAWAIRFSSPTSVTSASPSSTAFAAAAIVWLAIWLHGRKKEKKLFQYVEEENILEDIEKWEKLAQNELEMPEDKIEVDVLAEAYEIKKGKKKRVFTEKDLI